MRQVSEVEELVEAVRPYFAGRDPEIVGAALADLLSTFLAGHVLLDDTTGEIGRHETTLLRERILAEHLVGVRALILLNEDAILARMKANAS